MNSDDEMQTFLRDGIGSTLRRRERVSHNFREGDQERLMRQLETKLDWSNFNSTRGTGSWEGS